MLASQLRLGGEFPLNVAMPRSIWAQASSRRSKQFTVVDGSLDDWSRHRKPIVFDALKGDIPGMRFLIFFTKFSSGHRSSWKHISSLRWRHSNCYVISKLLLVVILVAATAGAQSQQAPPTRTPVVKQKPNPLSAKPIEREIGGEEIHNYEVKLRTGEFLHAIVDQRGISVVVTLYSPMGEKLLAADTFGLLGPEPISHEAQATGLYRLEVRPFSPELVRGRYQTSSWVKSSATAEDRKRMQAEKLVIEADVLQRSNSPESWQQSIEKYGQAASLWRELADQYWEAHAMNAQGNSYLSLGQKEKALELYESAVTLRKSIQDQKGVAASLINVGRVNARRGETQKALDVFSQAADFLKQSKSAAYEAYQLDEIALVCLQELKAFRKALEFADQALSIERSLNDKSGETLTLLIVGRAYSESGEKQKGLAILLDVLERHKAGYQRANQASTLINVALIYDELSEPQKAIEYFDQVLPLQKAGGNQYGAALTLHQLGVHHASIGNKSKAMEYFNLSLPQLRASGDVESLLALAENYVSLSEFSKALEVSNHALAMSRSGSNRKYEAFALLMIGIIRSQQGELREAQAVLEQSLSLFQTLKEPGGAASALLGLGLIHAGFGQTQKALDTLQAALTLSKSIGDNERQAATLQTLSILHSILGDKQKAEEYFRQASAFKKDNPEVRAAAVAVMIAGVVSLNNEDPQKALSSLTQALPAFRAASDKNNEAYILDAMGLLYNVLGEHKKALETYNQSLKLFRTVGNRKGEAASLSSIGFTFSKLKIYKEALEYLNQALVSARAQDDKHGEAGTLESIGYVYDQLSQFKSALEYYNRALPIYHEIGVRKAEAYTLTETGDSYRKIGELRKALALHIQALAIFREMNSLMGEGATLTNLMESWRDLGNPRLATLYGKQAVNAFQETRRRIQELDKGLQSSYRKSKEETYRKLADLLISEGRLAEAQQVLGFLKEEEFFQFVRRDPTALSVLKRADLTPEEARAVKHYNEKADVISSLAQEFDILRKQGTSPDDLHYQRLKTDLEAANTTFQVVLRQLEDEFGKESSVKRDLSESEGMRADLEQWGKGTVAIYTLVGEENCRVILTTSNLQVAREAEPKIKAEDLNKLVFNFRQAVQDPNIDPRPLGQKLYAILINPIAKDLQAAKAATLVWSLDGALRYLPIAALHDGKQYIAERYQNVIITPASHTRLNALPVEEVLALGVGVSKSFVRDWGAFSPLPSVPKELRAIINDGQSQSTGIVSGKILLDEAFTRKALEAALAPGRYPLVHIASHFSFKPGNDTESFLLLGDGDRLTLDKINITAGGKFFYKVELLTLSACDTATGGEANGKEVEGFAVLAQRQGAQSVLATLWPVSDESTQELMKLFYQYRLRKRLTKAEALRQAQLILLHGSAKRRTGEKNTSSVAAPRSRVASGALVTNPRAPFAHPYFWAPFILIGNWR